MTEIVPLPFDIEADDPTYQPYPAPKRWVAVVLLACSSILLAGMTVGMALGWAQTNDDLRLERGRSATLRQDLTEQRQRLANVTVERDTAAGQLNPLRARIAELEVALNQAEVARRAAEETSLPALLRGLSGRGERP